MLSNYFIIYNGTKTSSIEASGCSTGLQYELYKDGWNIVYGRPSTEHGYMIREGNGIVNIVI